MSTFWQRTLSGTVYVGLVIASILVHPLFFGVLFLGVIQIIRRRCAMAKSYLLLVIGIT